MRNVDSAPPGRPNGYAGVDRPLVVRGAAVSERIVFAAITSSVTFVETGLPSGTEWSVMLGTWGGTAVAPGNLTFGGVANGSYGFAAWAAGVYRATPGTGSVATNGLPLLEAISFATIPTGANGGPGPSTVLGLPAAEGIAVLVGILGAVVGGTLAMLIRWDRRHPDAGPSRP